MSKQRIVNKGPYIKNGGAVGDGTQGITNKNGSHVEALMAERARVAAAKQAQTPKPAAPTQKGPTL